MNRTLKLSMLVALALGSSQLLALELGQVQVKSALGQPLLAEIPLHSANPAELQGLTVKLASTEQFAHAGIVGGRTSIPLHFSVANTAGAHPVIRITSSVPVDNPYLDLLLEVDGHAGKSVREYAILLDPPGATAPVAVAAAPAEPMQAKPAQPTTPRVSSRPAAAPAAPAAVPAGVSNGRYGPVQSGQTLSGIARNVAPSGVDVQQMMLALKQANPDAFYKDNINALKSGAVLRVPTSAEAEATTLAAAVAEVRRQNSDWRGITPAKPAIVADAGTRATSSSSPTSTAASNDDRLALVPPKVGAGTGSQGAGKGDRDSAAVRDDLMRAKENVASLQQQSGDLKTRLKDLTDINSKNEHLLSLKDSEIAELQAKLAAARKTAAAAGTTPAIAASVAAAPASEPSATATLNTAVATAGTSASESTTPVAAASSASAMASPASAGEPASTAIATTSSVPTAAASTSAAMRAPAAAPAASVAKPAVATASAITPETTPVATPVTKAPWYMQTWAWAAGAAVIVLLIVLAMLGRRRKPAAAASKSASSLADRFSAPSSAGDGHLLDDDDADQEQLLDQLAEHPDDIYLHLELVTLYYSRRDVERFEAAAEAMHAHVTNPQQDEWQDVLHMGEDLAPEHPLFDHHDELAAPDHAAPGHPFDIDDYHDDAPTVVSPLPPSLPGGPKKVSEYNFNFDLTHPAATEPTSTAATPDEDVSVIKPHAPAETWAVPEMEPAIDPGQEHEPAEFSDDPVDTKLDLARAYLDMGDADGARAMLGEVLKEGSQMQRDTARRLLDGIS